MQKVQIVIKINNLCDLISFQSYARSGPCKEVSLESLWLSTDRDAINSCLDHSYQGEKQRVPVTALDAQLAALHPTMIKIDVEGFEYDLLQGASTSLAIDSCLAVIIKGQSAEISALLPSSGFDDIACDPILRSVQVFRCNQHQIRSGSRVRNSM